MIFIRVFNFDIQMKILFIYPVPSKQFQIARYQQGLGLISAVLKQGGHKTELLVTSRFDPDELDKAVGMFQPNLVGISCTSGLFRLSVEITQFLSKNYRLPVVMGGVHSTMMPEEALAVDGVFGICIGEGEFPMLELCDALDKGQDHRRIDNFWFNENGRIIRNEIRPLIQNLDSLPFPDRELFHFQQLIDNYPEAEFMASRGCPYRCTYCVNHALLNLYKGKGKFVRYRSVENLLAEIDFVASKYRKICHLGFHDDVFILNRAWLKEFCEKYRKRFNLPFWCNATVTRLDEEMLGWLKEAGCMEVRMGIESGNDYIRNEILEKRVEKKEIIRAFQLCKEAGIRAWSFNMIGLPYETPETIEETIRLNQRVKADQVFCSIFQPYVGTKSYDICKENGWLTESSVQSYFEREYVLQQPTIAREQVLFYYDIFCETVKHPRLGWLIKLLREIKVSKTKTLWNVWKRLRAKWIQLKIFLGIPLKRLPVR